MLSLRIAWRFLRSIARAVGTDHRRHRRRHRRCRSSWVRSSQSLQASLVDQTIGSAPQITVAGARRAATRSATPTAGARRSSTTDSRVEARHRRAGAHHQRRSTPTAPTARRSTSSAATSRELDGIYKHQRAHRPRAKPSLRSDEIMIGTEFAEKFGIAAGRHRRSSPCRADRGRRLHGSGHLRSGCRCVQRAPGVRGRRGARRTCSAGRPTSTRAIRRAARASRSPRPRSPRRLAPPAPRCRDLGVAGAERRPARRRCRARARRATSSRRSCSSPSHSASRRRSRSPRSRRPGRSASSRRWACRDRPSGPHLPVAGAHARRHGAPRPASLSRYFLLFGFSFARATFTIEPQPAVRLGLGRGRHGRGARISAIIPIAPHLEARPDRGDPEWLTRCCVRRRARQGLRRGRRGHARAQGRLASSSARASSPRSSASPAPASRRCSTCSACSTRPRPAPCATAARTSTSLEQGRARASCATS